MSNFSNYTWIVASEITSCGWIQTIKSIALDTDCAWYKLTVNNVLEYGDDNFSCFLKETLVRPFGIDRLQRRGDSVVLT